MIYGVARLHRDSFESAANIERSLPNRGHTVRDCDACKPATPDERRLPNRGHTIRYRDTCKTKTTQERPFPNRGYVLGNDTDDSTAYKTCFLRIDQAVIFTVICGVARFHRDSFESAATAERPLPNRGHAIRYRDAC